MESLSNHWLSVLDSFSYRFTKGPWQLAVSICKMIPSRGKNSRCDGLSISCEPKDNNQGEKKYRFFHAIISYKWMMKQVNSPAKVLRYSINQNMRRGLNLMKNILMVIMRFSTALELTILWAVISIEVEISGQINKIKQFLISGKRRTAETNFCGYTLPLKIHWTRLNWQ